MIVRPGVDERRVRDESNEEIVFGGAVIDVHMTADGPAILRKELIKPYIPW